MKALLMKLLAAYRNAALFMLKLRGKTPADVAGQRIVSGQAWNEFCDALKAAGGVLLFPGAPRDAFNQAEGYRYLTRLVRAGLEAFIESADPRAPVLMRLCNETVKLGSDNPDNYYQNAVISGEYDYRIHGTRGTVHYLGFGVQKGQYGQAGGMQTTAYVDASQFRIEPDGSFELILSRTRPAGDENWLPLELESSAVIVRQTFGDRQNERIAELRIERIGGDGLPSPVTAADIDKSLNTASTFVAGAAFLFAKWGRDFQQEENMLTLFDPAAATAAGGDPNIRYYHNYWRLAPDEALVIEVMPPQCDAWNFQLDNHWLESLDYRYYRIHVNQFTARYRPDGSVRVVVAHSDPGAGVDNWINTVGHDCGVMTWRWIRAESHPTPQVRVVKFSELAQLP
ncbi:conserved protein of unknown function [Sterolibacterium denitrificans]|uniref:DUF1214 domain-containing protein n=1 Tax=Sterolibacterium denitrificans TaxID=157592 RepID=A0A7Z7MUM9_9PROT|nr:DUF1214 domain-containing protein [Sterolibacterium denitrificans]SMB21947.1 conserved protein of unknown function [Sterolibacterium denitrificans]